MIKAIIIKTTPSARAIAMLPFEVSKAIEVVITLVKCLILPPTRITAPISEIALPKQNIIIVKRWYFASARNAVVCCQKVSPKDLKNNLNLLFRSSKIWFESAIEIGKTKKN